MHVGRQAWLISESSTDNWLQCGIPLATTLTHTSTHPDFPSTLIPFYNRKSIRSWMGLDSSHLSLRLTWAFYTNVSPLWLLWQIMFPKDGYNNLSCPTGSSRTRKLPTPIKNWNLIPLPLECPCYFWWRIKHGRSDAPRLPRQRP